MSENTAVQLSAAYVVALTSSFFTTAESRGGRFCPNCWPLVKTSRTEINQPHIYEFVSVVLEGPVGLF